ncbi:unnamed protein product, partial [Durusdinium trenchii]
VWWILEQPKGSCMEDHPAFQYFMRQVTTFRHYMTMGEYGGPTQKPTWLYSGLKCIEELYKFKPLCLPQHVVEEKQMVVHYKDKNGVDRICGGKDLKSSENYPAQFGVALARLRTHHAAQVKKNALRVVKNNLKGCSMIPLNHRASPRWIKWAELEPVFDFLM